MGLFFLKCYFLNNFALFPNIYSLMKIENPEREISESGSVPVSNL